MSGPITFRLNQRLAKLGIEWFHCLVDNLRQLIPELTLKLLGLSGREKHPFAGPL